ncbi:uncharacterized protein BP5553_02952 [Venustampulla echinocandica]|uniref:Epidermal growth factor receptor-like transmembrane-juxtamembrane segment domain-containing protein n=1 Tax=Venustampulla echinocandica TaxID=2656787 RepID=A0A370TSU9_9HELO|nr:uncharacterized protein BP5553_02951 [Venustampulla echinocandica]XP_031871268.1 uncharacterized protein BP5553_02952 [Venustampulla echinocandica]RDL38611.1 hypothetical protein BP5553_02951 [Venustampulla echinocandica]RDL38612.1 hypothetical protein BP5553_02952 [Venustampulla echinocandica]
MPLNDLVHRDADCPTGKSFWVCGSSSFRGCCSVDACVKGGCPDTPASNSITTIITLTPQPVTPLPSGSSSISSSSSSSLTSSSTTTASSTAATTTTDTKPPALLATASSTILPVNPSTNPPNSREKTSNVPLIAGVTCAIVAASILSVVVWFCWRRRQQKRSRFTISTYGSKEGKERHDSYYEGQHLNSDSYGGYRTNDSPEPQRDNNYLSRALLSPSAEKVHVPNDDQEKITVEAPLTRRQPDYESLPSQLSPEESIFPLPTPIVPRTPGTPPTPIHSPQQKQHPAYHLHQLSRHPAFRPGASPPRNQPPLWRHPAFRPEGEAQQLDSIPIIPRNELDGGPLSPRRSAGRSELPGEHTHAIRSQSHSEPDMLSRFSAKPSQKSSKSRESISRGGSGKTGVSTYSIPIGLGLEGSKAPFDLPLQRHSSPPPTSPKAPMRSNMNERDDHVMSWAAYGAGNLSGIGPSNSTGSERSRRQREIEQGSLGIREPSSEGNMHKENGGSTWRDWMGPPPRRVHSAWSELPETPLSAVYRESWTERESWARR